MTYARKVDANQSAVVRSLRGVPGVSVAVTSFIGEGFPDLVVGYKGKNYLFELKDGSKPPSQRILTGPEAKFQLGWKGQYDVVNSFDEIFKIIMNKV